LTDIVPVDDKRVMDGFIRLPWDIYRQDPHWVPPLIVERRQHLSARNPYFRHAKARFWIARRSGRVVGRISAQVDELYLSRYPDRTGFFGMIEAHDAPEIFTRLIETASQWLKGQGMTRLRGPFSLSINDECGLLVAGFDAPPSVMMGHARPYYGPQLEALGLEPVKDLLAYRIRSTVEPTRVMARMMSKVGGRIRVRALRRRQLKQELEIMRDIFNDAWSENWGFVPFTREEFLEMGQTLSLLVDKEFIQIAEVDGRPAAMIVLLPNVNEAARDLNGRLLPLGWARLLWRLKVAHPRTGRIALMGVRKAFQHKILGTALSYRVISEVQRRGVQRGIEEAEMSWVLEDNTRMRKIIEASGGEAYKRYRIYEKGLD